MSCSLLLPGKLAARQKDAFSLPAGAPNLLSSTSRIFSLPDDFWSTLVPLFQFFRLHLQPPAPVYVWLQLTVLLSPAMVPEPSLYVLDPTDLIGLFSWLRWPYLSLEQTFSNIIVSCWMCPTNVCFAQPLLVPLRSVYLLQLRPQPPASVHLRPPLRVSRCPIF